MTEKPKNLKRKNHLTYKGVPLDWRCAMIEAIL